MNIDRNIWNALLTVMAKRDMRYYLNGINVNVKHTRLTATDGRRVFVQNNIELPNGYIDFDSIIMLLDNSFKAPKNIDYIHIPISKFGTTDTVIKLDYCKKNSEYPILSRYAKLSDAKYPDIDKILPKKSDFEQGYNIAINPEYIADVAKVLGAQAMKINLLRCGDKFDVDFLKFKDIQYVVMGMRV